MGRRRRTIDSDSDEDIEKEEEEEEKSSEDETNHKNRSSKNKDKAKGKVKDTQSDSDEDAEQAAPKGMLAKLMSPKRKAGSKPNSKLSFFKQAKSKSDAGDDEDEQDDLEKQLTTAKEHSAKPPSHLFPPAVPQSKFHKKHLALRILCLLQVFTWLVGIELLCLFAQGCTIPSWRGMESKRLNSVSYTNPFVPNHGPAVLFTSGGVIVFAIIPTVIYLFSSEKRWNARAAALLSLCVAVYLFVVSMYYFSQVGKASNYVRYEQNPVVMNYYPTAESAQTVARSAASRYGAQFLVAAILMALTVVVTFVTSYSFPSDVRRSPGFILVPSSEYVDMDQGSEWNPGNELEVDNAKSKGSKRKGKKRTEDTEKRMKKRSSASSQSSRKTSKSKRSSRPEVSSTSFIKQGKASESETDEDL